jgi:FkbM family methyltransferase
MGVMTEPCTVQTRYGFSLQANSKSFFVQEIQRSEGNPFYRDGVGTYEHYESEIVLSLVRPGDFCVDAGAHIGYFSRLMIKAGASVLAVEPNPNHWPLLIRNLFNRDILGCNHLWDLRTDSVVIQDWALSDTSEQEPVPFHIPSEWDDGLGSLFWATDQQIKVFRFRLDDLLAGLHQSGKIRLIKMDIEGSELPALRGLGARLADVDHILIECASSNKDIPGINDLLARWTVKRCGLGEWKEMPAALPDGNYLFTNPKVTT